MWKPAEVVPQHKCTAVALFVGLIFAIFAYTGHLVYEAVEKSKNPSTSFVLSNKLYKYPDIYVCFYNFFGCDDILLEEQCMSSFNATEGGPAKAVFNPGGVGEEEIASRAFLTENRGWCVAFEASAVDVNMPERNPEDYILLNMYWYPGGGPNASTTCINEQGGWDAHSESMFMFLVDSDTGILSAGTQVSYSCMTSESNSHVFNYMGIGLTKVNKIREPSTATYKALSTSSHIYKDERNANITGIVNPYAWLSMEIAQSTDSLEEITEINPLEIAEMFGNIGGFWDLLLILWPIFFVTASRQDPHLKVRNFKKTVVRGSERAVDLTVNLPHPLRRMKRIGPHDGRSDFKQFSRNEEAGEYRPAWDTGRDTGNSDSACSEENNPSFGNSYRGVSRDTLTYSSRRQRTTPQGVATVTTAGSTPPMSSSARSRRLRAVASASPRQRIVRIESRFLKEASPRVFSRTPRTMSGSDVRGSSSSARAASEEIVGDRSSQASPGAFVV